MLLLFHEEIISIIQGNFLGIRERVKTNSSDFKGNWTCTIGDHIKGIDCFCMKLVGIHFLYLVPVMWVGEWMNGVTNFGMTFPERKFHPYSSKEQYEKIIHEL